MLTSLFGVVVPGRPLITEFQPIDETKAISILEHPLSVAEITFFLLPTTPVPPGYWAVLYYAVPPFDKWQILGAISPDKPSGTFRTGWSTKEDMIGVHMVQLGVALEPFETIQNLQLVMSGVEDRFAFAHKIALDLFHYMASFSTPTPSSSDMMVVPTNIFDRWMERFERKYSQDPNFMMKSPM